jgi:hypothetical protein
MDLTKHLDKKIKVKFFGGREGNHNQINEIIY